MTRFSISKLVVALTAVMAPLAGAFGMAKATPSLVGIGGLVNRKRHKLPPDSGSGDRRNRSHRSRMTPRTQSGGADRRVKRGTQSTSLSMSMSMSDLVHSVRGGAVSSVLQNAKNWNQSPTNLFNTSLLAVALLTVTFKILQQTAGGYQRRSVNGSTGGAGEEEGAPRSSSEQKQQTKKPKSVQDLQVKFLSVFWLLRCADWLQGPYFYEVYASKVFNGVPASIALVSRLFLTGFASTALFGPLVGRAVDANGRRRGTIAFALIYALGAASTKSPLLQVLFLGRVLSGIGTSLLFSAPESWLVGESQKNGDDPDGKYLGETFGMAYAGDSIVAILAGQLAGVAAAKRGPSGPFELSTVFLALGGLLTAFLWSENVAPKDESSSNSSGKPSIKEAIQVVRDDPKIMLVGGVQSLFEAAMYIFVLQWPPAISRAVAKAFGDGVATPYGTVFSCFMACCLFGSTLFGQFAKMGVPSAEAFTAGMLAVATAAMSIATFTVSSSTMSLPALVASFFAFEACVGMYFPSIGTLRSKYVPDSHRSVIMNLFGIPLNVLVVSVFLSISKLGLNGALGISSGALALATLCMVKLNAVVHAERVGNDVAQKGAAST